MTNTTGQTIEARERVRMALQVVQGWWRAARKRWRIFPSGPLRRIVDREHVVLRWNAEERRADSIRYQLLECGHLLDCRAVAGERRRCWKCARDLPPDGRRRHRKAVVA